MSTFETLFAKIAARPGLYVGIASLRAVDNYLFGYCHALMDMGQPDPLAGWGPWVEMKFLISDPAWHWTRILVHAYGSDQAAFDALPTLYAEFRISVAECGVDGINEEHYQRFIAAYGQRHHAPETTHTTDPY